MANNNIEQYFLNHPKVFIDLILRWFPVNMKVIESIKDKLNYENLQRLCKNSNFKINKEFLEQFKNDLDWDIISRRIEGNLSNAFEMSDAVNPNSFCREDQILNYFNYDLLEKDTEFRNKALAENTNLIWNVELLKKYQKYWRWDSIFRSKSIPWDYEIIRFGFKNASQSHSDSISENPAIPWSLELIEDFEYSWTWQIIVESEKVWDKVFKGNISDEFVSSYLNNLKSDQFNMLDYVEPLHSNPKSYELTTKINFGKYIGNTIIDIYGFDPSYIEFCLNDIGYFIIEEGQLEKLQKTNNKYNISKKALIQNEKKITYYCNKLEEENYNSWLDELAAKNDNLDPPDWI